MTHRLGIPCCLEDDERPLYNRPIWQELCKKARSLGMRVYIKPIGYKLTNWSDGERKYAINIVVNEQVPNHYKSMLLAKEICLWAITGMLKTDKFSEDEIEQIREEADKAGQKLYKAIHKMVYPPPKWPEGYKSINTAEGWNALAEKRRGKIDEAHKRILHLMQYPEDATPEEREVMQPFLDKNPKEWDFIQSYLEAAVTYPISSGNLRFAACSA